MAYPDQQAGSKGAICSFKPHARNEIKSLPVIPVFITCRDCLSPAGYFLQPSLKKK